LKAVNVDSPLRGVHPFNDTCLSLSKGDFQSGGSPNAANMSNYPVTDFTEIPQKTKVHILTPKSLITGSGLLLLLITFELFEDHLDLLFSDGAALTIRLILVIATAVSFTYFGLRKQEVLHRRTGEEIAVRKKAEDALHEQTALLADAQLIGRMGSWRVDLLSGRVIWSDAACDLFGITPAEVAGTFEHFYSFILEEDRSVYDDAAAKGSISETLFEVEYRIRRADGVVRWMYSRGNFQFDTEGTAISRIGIVMDITERKAASDQVAQKSALLRIAGKVARLGGWSIELPDRTLTWSDENCLIHDVPPGHTPTLEEGIGYYLPEDRAKVLGFVAACENDGTPYDFEFQKITASGRKIWVRSTGEAVRDAAGNIKRLQGAIQDITERKRADIDLLRQKTKLAVLFDLMPAMVWFKDTENRIIRVNELVAVSIGKTVEEINGRPSAEIYPETADKFFEDDLEVIRSGKPKLGIVEPLLAKDGKQLWVETDKVPYRDESGKIIGIVVVARDITDKRASEIELLKSRERLALAQEVAKIGSFELELGANRAIVSSGFEMIYGIRESSRESNYADWSTQVYVEDLPQVAEDMETALLTGELNSEFRITHTDGSIRWMWGKGKVFHDEQGGAIRMIGVNIDITESKLAADALRVSEERYRDLIENAHDIIFTQDLEGNYTSVNNACERITGYTREETLGRNLMQTVAPEHLERVLEMTAKKLAGEPIPAFGMEIIAKDGHKVAIDVNSRIIFENGVPVGVQGIARDVTDRAQLEDQLRQAQKMEAVGQMAGGIAHDFNNMLTAINGFSDLTLRKMKADDPLRAHIEEIKKAGVRSADLTNQLLAFSRRQILQPAILNLNQVIMDTGNMLERLIGEDVELVTVLDGKTGRVKIDPGQLTQIITNLALNARDAMPQGGKLTFETKNMFLDAEYARQHINALPGAYVKLAVSDNGTGMDDETQAHIFEPFFTTKEIGKGTGLGLASVYGIVRQSGGSIMVYSEVGVGTTFKIYLPRVIDECETVEIEDGTSELSTGTETILLVEDEDIVRSLTRQVLETCGYNVLEAPNGREALAICLAHEKPIDLLLTDVVMPEMGGRELAELVVAKFPQMEVLFASGYTDDAVVRHGVIDATTNFIQKPFTTSDLAQKVRDLLDTRGSE